MGHSPRARSARLARWHRRSRQGSIARDRRTVRRTCAVRRPRARRHARRRRSPRRARRSPRTMRRSGARAGSRSPARGPARVRHPHHLSPDGDRGLCHRAPSGWTAPLLWRPSHFFFPCGGFPLWRVLALFLLFFVLGQSVTVILVVWWTLAPFWALNEVGIVSLALHKLPLAARAENLP